MPPSGPYLFVHIPKTAGTSLRVAMERAYDDRILLDYGPNAEQTSEAIRELVYRRRDLPALATHLRSHQIAFLAGHVGYMAYHELFPPERVITFLREPVARVVSEWSHARRNYGYPHDLTTFARDDSGQNRQSRVLSGAPLERLGFVGLSERYGDGLDVLNARFDLRLEYVEANVTPGRRVVSGSYDVAPEDREIIAAANTQDAALHRRVRGIWERATAAVSARAGAIAR